MSCTNFRVNSYSIVYLNIKELLAWSRRHIWSLSDSNVIQIHNHLLRKRTLNHLAKLTLVFVYQLKSKMMFRVIKLVYYASKLAVLCCINISNLKNCLLIFKNLPYTLSKCPGGHPVLHRGLKLNSKILAENLKMLTSPGPGHFHQGSKQKLC